MELAFLKWFSGKARDAVEREAIPLLSDAAAKGFILRKDLRRVRTLVSKPNLLARAVKAFEASHGRIRFSGDLARGFEDWSARNPGARYEAYEESPDNRIGDELWNVLHWCRFGQVQEAPRMAAIAAEWDAFAWTPAQREVIELARRVAADFSELAGMLEALGEGLSESEAERYRAPPAALHAVRMVTDVVTAQIGEVYEATVAWHRDRLLGFLAELERIKAEDPAAARRRVREDRSGWLRLVESAVYDADMALKDDHAAILDRVARKMIVDPMRDGFVRKMAGKLSSVVERKGGLREARGVRVETDSGAFVGVLHFAFEDGDEFDVATRVRWNVSSRGKPFIQLPSTFHDVRHGGDTHARLSERDMNELFAMKEDDGE